MRVLFVDDDKGVSQSVETGLRRKGHVVDTADLGADALALIESTSYDLVVLDVGLPDMDGYHIVRRMKIDQNETPVLMQTGLAGQDLTDDAETLGIQGILAKPFSIHELLAYMDSVVAPSDAAGRDSMPAVDPAGPPQTTPQGVRQTAPEPGSGHRPAGPPAPRPDPVPQSQTPRASGRALRRALMTDAGPIADAGPKVRPAPAVVGDPGPPPAPEPSPEPVAEPAAEPPRPAAPGPPPAPAPKPRPEPAPAAQAAPASLSLEVPAGDDHERRDSERAPRVEAALITEDGNLIACVILDLSQGGAQVKLAAPNQSCPKMFTLQPLDGSERRCEVRWRSGAKIGLKFI